MNIRPWRTAGRIVSEVGLGTWQLGGTEWGPLDDATAHELLHTAVDSGITFFDTADIYGQGRSETLLGNFFAERGDRSRFFIATKLGRRSDPGWPDNFTPAVIRRHVTDSLQRLQCDSLDLIQTHCIPGEVTRRADFWGVFQDLKTEGLIQDFGASVESLEEALDCLQVPELGSLQIIFNVFRQKPIDELFDAAERRAVAVIVRLPLASGLLSGRLSATTPFAPTDHRVFNRDGQAFNVGETFAGLPFDTGLALVEDLRGSVPEGWSMSEWALRWCLDFSAVTTVIPGATKPAQVRANAAASDRPPLPRESHEQLRAWYRSAVAPHIRGKY